MKISTAAALEIGQLNRPIVTSYQVGLVIFFLYKEKTYRGEKLSLLTKDLPQRSDYARIIRSLLASGSLQNTSKISHRDVYAVLSQNDPSAGDAACCVDPFCYVSHLSAMEHHGFTDRLPKLLFLSAPKPAAWTRLANEKMQKDLGKALDEYKNAGMPILRRMRLPRIAGKTVSIQTSAHYDAGAYVATQGTALRVSSIGRTFLDMVRDPDLCGGIYHVLDVFEQNAPRYLRLIVDEVDQHGNGIDKARFGYILDERLGLSDPRIDVWAKGVQRGGSRKLVAQSPYAPVFSEKWALSLNIEEKVV